MRKTDNCGRDPFRGYPPPPSSWLRIALWAFIGVALAALIALAAMAEG